MGALFWVLLIGVAAFHVLRFRSSTLRVRLQGSTPLNWLFTSAYLCVCGAIARLLAMSARAYQQDWAAVAFSVVILVIFASSLFSLARVIWEKFRQSKRTSPS